MVACQHIADGTDLAPHRESFVAEPVGNREVSQAPGSRCCGECRQQNPVNFFRERLNHQESTSRFNPLMKRNKQDVDCDQKTEDESDHRPR